MRKQNGCLIDWKEALNNIDNLDKRCYLNSQSGIFSDNKNVKRTFFLSLFIFAVGACTSTGTGQPAGKAIATPPQVARATPTVDTRQLSGELEEGRRLYISLDCINCHGGTGEGGIGATIKGTTRTLKEVQDQLRMSSGMMPSFGDDKISDQEIKVLYGYIKSLENIK